MPVRVRSRAQHHNDGGLRTPSPFGRHVRFGSELPDISTDDSFRTVIKKLSIYIADSVTLPSTFEQLRTTAAGDALRILVDHLGRTCSHPAIVNALLALKWHYGAAIEEKGLNDARASACEIVAWRFLAHLSEREVVDYCLYEIPDPAQSDQSNDEEEGEPDEHSALLSRPWSGETGGSVGRRSVSYTGSSRRNLLLQSINRLTMSMKLDDDDDGDGDDEEEDDPTAPFVSLNALEIAAIADAKRFLSQTIVQKIITGIWNGDIIFWDNLSVHSVKKPRFYNPHTTDPFSRLRVPKYLKSFEVIFFASFLFLYYAVLVERHPLRITPLEISLYLWIAAFTYDELSEWIDAGSIFYAADVWNIFDMAMILIGFAYIVMRIVGLETGNTRLVDLAFDVLALEALFMVPRVCSILSLSPYWGTLIPCLKEMGKDFVKFMVLVIVIYIGFLTTFSLVGRDVYSLGQMTWFVTKIFFGSSSTGFEIMDKIDPVFGPPLMVLFITLSSILLMGSLTGMLSNSFSRVITHAREEYLYVYSVYVLEASTSNRLTHFYPPFNLLALVIFRPLRLFLPSDNKFRSARIVLLKATHLPIVAVIQAYEWLKTKTAAKPATGFNPGGGLRGPNRTSSIANPMMAKKLAGPPMRNRQSGGSLHSDMTTSLHIAPDGHRLAARQAAGQVAGQVASDAGESETFGDSSQDTDMRYAELAAKIDRLTELVIAMQGAQSQTLADIPLS